MLLALVGGIIGLVTTIALGAVVLYLLSLAWQAVFGVSRMRQAPVGIALAVFIIPIAGAVWGAALGWNLHQHDIGSRVRKLVDTSSMIDRAWIAWGVVWSAGLAILIPTLGPFWRSSRYWYIEHDGIQTVLWWIIPIIGGYVVSRLVAWVMRGSR